MSSPPGGVRTSGRVSVIYGGCALGENRRASNLPRGIFEASDIMVNVASTAEHTSPRSSRVKGRSTPILPLQPAVYIIGALADGHPCGAEEPQREPVVRRRRVPLQNPRPSSARGER